MSVKAGLFKALYYSPIVRKMGRAILLPGRHFVMLPTFICNYHCPYCIYQKNRYGALYLPNEHSGKEWAEVVNRFKSAVISVSGGEPFLWAGIVDFFQLISRKHYLSVTSNLSWDVDEYLPSIKSCRARFTLYASFHSSMTGFDPFAERVEALVCQGVRVIVSIVIHPSIIGKLEYFKKLLARINVPLEFASYIDPAYQYSEKEKSIVKQYIEHPYRQKQMGFDTSPRLKTCQAGINHYFSVPNGDVFACSGGFYFATSSIHEAYRSRKAEFYLGNLFDGTFKPRASKMLCKYPCSEGCDQAWAKPVFIGE